MIAAFPKRILAVLIVGLGACAGHPIQLGVYTPASEDQVLVAAHAKVLELGYTIVREDSIKHEIVAQRPADSGAEKGEIEEMHVQIAVDVTGSTKLQVTTSHVLPATADRPVKRTAASIRTNGDANKVIYLYMKVKRSI